MLDVPALGTKAVVESAVGITQGFTLTSSGAVSFAGTVPDLVLWVAGHSDDWRHRHDLVRRHVERGPAQARQGTLAIGPGVTVQSGLRGGQVGADVYSSFPASVATFGLI